LGPMDWAKKIFGTAGAQPADLRRLSAASEGALGSSLQSLRTGVRGWITLGEAAQLFSTQELQYAFGEMDEEGKTRLGQFAAQYRCMPEFMPTEGRMYFTRQS
jgi:hypothetical protein